METGERWRLGHRPALDGLRGVAVLLVVACHAGLPGFSRAGAVGVGIFFTLSGFLITALMLGERDRTSQVSLRAFYRRRAYRLAPALIAFLAAMMLLGALMPRVFFAPIWSVVTSVAYLQNWVCASGHPVPGATSITWSLCVEEQFYLIWPLTFVLARRWPKAPLVFAAAGVVIAPALRFLLWHGGSGSLRVYYGTDTRMDGILLGCLLAFAVRRQLLARWYRSAGVVGLSALVATFSMHSSFDEVMLFPLVVPVATCGVIAWASTAHVGWMTARPLVEAGRISYGLYLWHYPFTFLVAPLLGVPMPLAVAMGLGCAVLSYRFVEQPLLRLKNRQAPDSGMPQPTNFLAETVAAVPAA